EHLTTIEINGTFYRTQSPKSFAKWRDETPDGFVFSVKGHRAIVNKKKLAETGEGLEWFFGSGVLELGDKLGPVLWQFAPFKRYDTDDFAAFLGLLPKERDGRPLRHVVEVRHRSFLVAECIDLLREHDVAIVYADSDTYPAAADVTAPFVYLRLQRSLEENDAGYSATDLDAWAERVRTFAAGGVPDDLERVLDTPPASEERDVFAYFISGAKVRAPAAAMALIDRVA
ncbi:MAG: DUF72 domain-containing protein, partial [bacterium]|nr:DUF72 domain-containing protein [bacterium]